MQTEEPVVSRTILLKGMALTLLCLFAGLLPWSRIFSVPANDTNYKALFFLLSRIIFWLALGITYLYVKKEEKQNFLLWKEQEFSFGIYVAFFFVTIGTIIIGLLFIALTLKLLHLLSASAKLQEIILLFRDHKILMVFTALTAGVIEELLFRGYMMPRLELLYKNKYITIGISSLLFGLLHIGYGTLINIIGPFFIGLIFAIHYYKFRNIKILIFIHFTWDLMALVLRS